MTAAQLFLIALIPLAYLLGSVPFGLLVGLARGVDVRDAGSGNIGATNVGRLLGGKFFALVFVLDLLKGAAPMAAAALILRHGHGGNDPRAASAGTYLLWLAIGAAAIAGHMFSLFLSFKGGKGVATSAGVALGLFPYYTFPALAAIGVWLILFKLTRYVSVASVVAAVVFPLAYVAIALAQTPPRPVFGRQWPLLAFAALIGLMIVYKHRANLARLRAGTELRFGGSRESGNGQAPGGRAPGGQPPTQVKTSSND